MYIHILWVQTLRLCRRARDSCNGGLHLLPIHGAERFPQAMFRRLPTLLSRRDLPLPRFRQAKHSLALIFSRPDVDPPLLAQQGQRTCKRSAVHGKAGTQRFLVGLADNGEGGEQAELGDFDSGLAELLDVNAGHKSGDAPKVLTRARESKERVRGMIVANRHTIRCIYMFSWFVSSLVRQRWILPEDRSALLHRGEQEWSEATKWNFLSAALFPRKLRRTSMLGPHL